MKAPVAFLKLNQQLTLAGLDDVLGTSSLKMISGLDDVLSTSSAKISEYNLLEFQIVQHCQNGIIAVLSVADARYRQQQVTAW